MSDNVDSSSADGSGNADALKAIIEIVASQQGAADMSRSGDSQVKRDPVGMIYDRTWVSSDGTVHYSRDRAQGSAQGSAHWTSEHDCNPVCGCHLASKCGGCNTCMNCDSCYCAEWDYYCADWDGHPGGSED